MTRELVIAHFNEKLDWFMDSFESNGVRYTMYSKGMGRNKLPNIGREAHTFVHHIVSRWQSLSDVTTFVQGNPFDHCKTILDRITEPVEWFSWMADMIFECNADGSPNWDQDVGIWYEGLIGRKFPGVILFGVGGQFSATKGCLQSVPLHRWMWMLNQAESNPLFPWLMERTWGELLSSR